jgi:hypothetical protein
MADESTPTTDTIAEGGGEQSRPNLQEINEQPGQTDALEARRAAANRSERYGADDLTVEDGEIRVRDTTRKQQVAEQTVYDPDELQVTDDGSVEPKREPAPEATRVVLYEDDPSGEVAWVGPDGQRIETGQEAAGSDGSPYAAYVDVPDREGEWQLQVGDDTVDRVEVGSAGAARDNFRADVPAGWNADVIEVDAESGTGSVAQEAYDPDKRYASASLDEDVVAGTGADEALQAGAEPEQLSPRNPIDESEGEQIAGRIAGPQTDEGESRTISDPTDLNDADDNRAVRERVASQLDGVSADEVDIVATGSGYEAIGPGGETVTSLGSGGGVPGRQPTDATFDGSRSVGDRSTGAGATAGLEAARQQARQQVANQSARIDESDVQTEVVDGRVRGYVPPEQQRSTTGRAPEGGDARLRAAADDGPPPVEGGDVALANVAQEQRADEQTTRISDPTEVSGGDARLRTVADAQDTDLRATEATAQEPLNYGRRDRYVAGLDVLAGSTDEAVGRAVDAARDGDVAGVGDALAGSTDESIGRAARASAAGDRERAADNLGGGFDDAATGVRSGLATALSNAPGVPSDNRGSILPGVYGDATATGVALGEDVETGEVNRATTGRLTRGGLLTERDEQRLREAGAQFNQDVRSGISEGAAVSPLTLSDEAVRGGLEAAGARTEVEATVDTPIGQAEIDTVRRGEGSIERVQENAAESIATAVNPFALAQAGETGVEVSSNLPRELEVGGAATAAVGSSAGAIGRETSKAIATDARTDPTGFAGSLAGEAVLGAGIGRGVGTAARRSTDRVRTAGGTKVDLEEVTNPETAAFYRGEGDAEDARFPGAEDPDLYQTDPAEAVRQQARDYTPAVIEEQFERAGVTEGTDLKKGLETEPEGPDAPVVGDGAGFRTLEGGYESPGAFAGPELSPNFLAVGERSYSLRPGLPGLGGRPTGVIARTDVENPDADTLDEFNRELVEERAGDTTAVTKPADEVAAGEIEAVFPPEARFRAVDGVSSGGNRFGVGADFYTEVRGRRVPLRLVAPEDRVDATSAVDDVGDAGGRRIESYYRAPGNDVDRPSPTPSRPASSETSRGASGGVSGPLSDTLSESSTRSRRDSRVVSDAVSSGLTSAGSSGVASSRSGFGSSSGGTPTEVGTPTDFEEYGGGGSYGFGEPTQGSEITTGGPPTTGGPAPPTDPPNPPTKQPPEPPQFDLEQPDEFEAEDETAPTPFENRIAGPYDFLF